MKLNIKDVDVQQIENYINEYIHLISNNLTEYRVNVAKQKLINSLCNQEHNMVENIAKSLQSASDYQYYRELKLLFQNFLNYCNVDYDVSQIPYVCKYISFEQLQYHIEKNHIWKNRQDANNFLMAKLFAYLLWVGLDKETIAELKRLDYNVARSEICTKDKTYCLNDPIYKESTIYIKNELALNVQSQYLKVYSDGKKDYSIRQPNDMSQIDDYKLVIDENESIIRSRSTGNNLCRKIQTVVTHYIYNANQIYKSGMFYKLFKLQRDYGININSINISKIAHDRLGYNYNSNYNLYNEFAQYKRFITE